MVNRGPEPVVVTMGKSMALFDAVDPGPPTYGGRFSLRVAGAESNFAIGLARLGHSTRWISRVGDDILGDLIVRAVQGRASMSARCDATRCARRAPS